MSLLRAASVVAKQSAIVERKKVDDFIPNFFEIKVTPECFTSKDLTLTNLGVSENKNNARTSNATMRNNVASHDHIDLQLRECFLIIADLLP